MEVLAYFGAELMVVDRGERVDEVGDPLALSFLLLLLLFLRCFSLRSVDFIIII